MVLHWAKTGYYQEDIGCAVDFSSHIQGSGLNFFFDKNNESIHKMASKQMEIHNVMAELILILNICGCKEQERPKEIA